MSESHPSNRLDDEESRPGVSRSLARSAGVIGAKTVQEAERQRGGGYEHVSILVACPGRMQRVFRAGHPAWRRCSSLEYSRYARSSRLASRAPRSEIRITFDRTGH